MDHNDKQIALKLEGSEDAGADQPFRDGSNVTGFVSGVLERIDLHDACEFVLFPPIAGQSVRCLFPMRMLDTVVHALQRIVTVTGAMHYEKNQPFPSLVHVERMEIHPDHDSLPTLAELKGFARGCTGSQTAVDYVRAIRDE